jgi:hypothetical protein
MSARSLFRIILVCLVLFTLDAAWGLFRSVTNDGEDGRGIFVGVWALCLLLGLIGLAAFTRLPKGSRAGSSAPPNRGGEPTDR